MVEESSQRTAFVPAMQHFYSASSINEFDSERQTIAASQAVKPLPSLPRGWSRICHETGLFLRSIGLGIVVTAFHAFSTKNFLEPEKVAIRRSRVTALLRTLIHVVPVGVAIFEIVLNFKSHFVGETFDKPNYLQFAAKAHEIAMQASLATILLSYIRYQISVDRGMPFGAVLSSVQFLQVSYLWSVELWSSILSKDFQPRKKACFAVLILTCITIAATAGPSSANLLIAQQGLWPTNSTSYAVNASVLDIWPDRLDDKRTKRHCAMMRFDSQDDRCPLRDLFPLLESGYQGLFRDAAQPLLDVLSVPIFTPEASYSRTLLISPCYGPSSFDQYCASVPQTNLLDGFWRIQYQQAHYLNRRKAEIFQLMEKNYYQPYTTASCVADVVKDASDQAPLRFARISETESEGEKAREIVSIPSLTKGHIINNMSGDNSDFHVHWVDLPIEIFNTGIPGAVIVNPQDPNGSSYNITTCTLNAGWGSSTLSSWSSLPPSTIESHMSNIPSSWHNPKILRDDTGYQFSNPPNFANSSNFAFPQRRISISQNWMEFLNPTVVLANNLTGKFISLALSALQSEDKHDSEVWEQDIAQTLILILTVAVADTGIEIDWGGLDCEEGSCSDPETVTRTCDPCLVFEIDTSLYGWSYSVHGTTAKLAITVMLAYCALVFGHIIYSTISGVSSTAWDSVAEIVALAMNSSPTKILQNTCAGIIGRQALQTSVRVLATTPGHLELVFGEIQDPNMYPSKVMMNRKYGRLDGQVHDDKEDAEPEFYV